MRLRPLFPYFLLLFSPENEHERTATKGRNSKSERKRSFSFLNDYENVYPAKKEILEKKQIESPVRERREKERQERPEDLFVEVFLASLSLDTNLFQDKSLPSTSRFHKRPSVVRLSLLDSPARSALVHLYSPPFFTSCATSC